MEVTYTTSLPFPAVTICNQNQFRWENYSLLLPLHSWLCNYWSVVADHTFQFCNWKKSSFQNAHNYQCYLIFTLSHDIILLKTPIEIVQTIWFVYDPIEQVWLSSEVNIIQTHFCNWQFAPEMAHNCNSSESSYPLVIS